MMSTFHKIKIFIESNYCNIRNDLTEIHKFYLDENTLSERQKYIFKYPEHIFYMFFKNNGYIPANIKYYYNNHWTIKSYLSAGKSVGSS